MVTEKITIIKGKLILSTNSTGNWTNIFDKQVSQSIHHGFKK